MNPDRTPLTIERTAEPDSARDLSRGAAPYRSGKVAQGAASGAQHLPFFDRLLLVLASLVTLVEAWQLRRILRYWNPDLKDYGAWYSYILQHGRWSSLHGMFSSYNPPYIYLLALVSNLNGVIQPTVALKVVLVPCLLLAAVLAYSLCRRAGCSVRRSWLAAWILLIAPEVVANGLFWGQTDILETSCLLLFAWLLLKGRPTWAMAAAGVALSFKLQAIFAGPAVLAFLLTGEIPWLSLLGLPAGYLAAMLPAMLAGRPLYALLGAYTGQVAMPERLAMGIANPYEFLLSWTNRSGVGPKIWWIEHVGIGLTALASFLLCYLLVRNRPAVRAVVQPCRLLAALSFSSLMVPFLLPKMHDRYLYIGDTFALLLGIIEPAFFLPAILLQVAALLAYAPYFLGFRIVALWYVLPVALVTVSLIALLRFLMKPQSAEGWRALRAPATLAGQVR